MPSIRNQVQFPVQYPDGTNKGNVTSGRHSLFGVLYLTTPGSSQTPKPVGGLSAFSIEETNATHFQAQAGNDWLEPVFGMRQWQGNGSRFQIRGADLQELLQREYSNLSDIDFRFTPFIWQYTFNYTSPTGSPNYESAVWQWMTIFITSYRISIPDPFSLISEDFQFIGKGYSRHDLNNEYSMSNPTYLQGAGAFATSSGTNNALNSVGSAASLIG